MTTSNPTEASKTSSSFNDLTNKRIGEPRKVEIVQNPYYGDEIENGIQQTKQSENITVIQNPYYE